MRGVMVLQSLERESKSKVFIPLFIKNAKANQQDTIIIKLKKENNNRILLVLTLQDTIYSALGAFKLPVYLAKLRVKCYRYHIVLD